MLGSIAQARAAVKIWHSVYGVHKGDVPRTQGANTLRAEKTWLQLPVVFYVGGVRAGVAGEAPHGV